MLAGLSPTAERFFAKVVPGVCWEWQAARTKTGYGVFKVGLGQGTVLAHRFSYELLVAPVPLDMQLDHLCRVRWCVDPDHLEVVTLAVNVLRGYNVSACNARKTHCSNGHELARYGYAPSTRPGQRNCRACSGHRVEMGEYDR